MPFVDTWLEAAVCVRDYLNAMIKFCRVRFLDNTLKFLETLQHIYWSSQPGFASFSQSILSHSEFVQISSNFQCLRRL